MTELTTEQINNWRNMLISTLDPYALLLPDADIQVVANRLQAKLNTPRSGNEQNKTDC